MEAVRGLSMSSSSSPMADGQYAKDRCGSTVSFRMPLHYPRYTRADYEVMPEWKVDRLLADYGLPAIGDLAQKRSFAMGAFLWH